MKSPAPSIFSKAVVAAAAALALAIPGMAGAHGPLRFETQQQPVSSFLESTPTGARRSSFAALPTDLWDRPFVYRRTTVESLIFYSTGPNGLDDGGRGDDIAPQTLDDYYRIKKIRFLF